MSRKIHIDYMDFATLKQSADIIELYNENITYLGFKGPGVDNISTADAKWSILKIEANEDPWTYPRIIDKKFADGTMNFDKIWDYRDKYNYYFRKWS